MAFYHTIINWTIGIGVSIVIFGLIGYRIYLIFLDAKSRITKDKKEQYKDIIETNWRRLK